jgi:hypothetical protein
MLSAAYQQQSNDRPDGLRENPDNSLLWKMNRRRLDFEATRDALLAVARRLDGKLGGPSVPNITSPAATRWTLYGFLDRLNVPELYRTFDFPSPDASNPQRDSTTVAPQALFMMNNPFVIECARGLIKQPQIAAEADMTKRVACLYRLLYGRDPASEEIRLARQFLHPSGVPARWERYAQALMLANEFVFID